MRRATLAPRIFACDHVERRLMVYSYYPETDIGITLRTVPHVI